VGISDNRYVTRRGKFWLVTAEENMWSVALYDDDDDDDIFTSR
jgi:hypothetical protein